MHFGCPNKQSHTKAADEALHRLLQVGNDPIAIENVLLIYEYMLCGCGDYIYLLRNFGNTGHVLQANKCYEIAMWGESGRISKRKLTCAMIDILGRLGKINHAMTLFQKANYEGYGNSVNLYSAMISAYGCNGSFPEATNLFKSMNSWGLEPNLGVYNALIDAAVKVEVDFHTIMKYFDEMVANGLVPNQATYNSLLSACATKGMWEYAQNLLTEMVQKGIDQDLNTYNAYLSILCKGGQMDLATMVMENMCSRKLSPNVMTYSNMIDGYAKANLLEDAQNLYAEMKRKSIG